MISLKNISKSFQQKGQETFALKNINLEVNQGEILGIIGSSGAGKSTLLRCVNLLEIPDSGEIIINSKDLLKFNSKQLANERKKIGMIFQHFNLLSSRTVFGNIALPLELEKKSKKEIETKVNELLKIVGLEDKANSYPSTLSGGQKQRVAIARALANDPHLLLCDEATSALDPATTEIILQLLTEINQRFNITIILITHQIEVVKSICTRVAVIDKGQLIVTGKLGQILIEIDNPIINQFKGANTMKLPQEIYKELRADYSDGLFPLIEVELNGLLSFNSIFDIINQKFNLTSKLIKADIEYLDNKNFGSLLLQLKGDKRDTDVALNYFNQINVQNKVVGYV